MDFRDALNNVIAELTPQPWDYTMASGTTLRVIPAGLPSGPGAAEVNVRITRRDATGLYAFGITGPDSRGVAQVGVPTSVLPSLIKSLSGPPVQTADQDVWWESIDLVDGTLFVRVAPSGVAVTVTEVHSDGREEKVFATLPEAQRLPLASALGRALDVARGWES
ncbi:MULTISPECIES: hypothetical protein [unclassified Streptomyces]|uniref:hypothetical protein n=1 Tax=unclassified Streptomyces TaxID=2593676 RepID=UPI0036EBBE92